MRKDKYWQKKSIPYRDFLKINIKCHKEKRTEAFKKLQVRIIKWVALYSLNLFPFTIKRLNNKYPDEGYVT